MIDPRWIHLPDGPWVLPNEDSDIYVRLITKTETAGQPPTFTLTGPGYDATEHATLGEAMAEAEFYRFELVDDRPPMPTQSPLLPKELFVLESVWERWSGSTTAIAALAKRADEWMDTHWTSFQKVLQKATARDSPIPAPNSCGTDEQQRSRSTAPFPRSSSTARSETRFAHAAVLRLTQDAVPSCAEGASLSPLAAFGLASERCRSRDPREGANTNVEGGWM